MIKMIKESYISNELKNKIIYHKNLTKEEINMFFNYVIYKIKIINTYKKKINKNLSKEYTSLYSEILFSYNLDTQVSKINNHYFCITNINNSYYLCDLCEEKYKYIELTNEIYQKYVTHIKEKTNKEVANE